jgi:uncharacterized protein (DUF433 family)
MTIDTCTIPLQEDETGTTRVQNTRVTLDSVVHAFRDGATAEEIAQRLPAISLGAIYAAITFYLQKRSEVDAYLARREAESEKIWTEIESRPETKDFRARLLARATRDVICLAEAGAGKSS